MGPVTSPFQWLHYERASGQRDHTIHAHELYQPLHFLMITKPHTIPRHDGLGKEGDMWGPSPQDLAMGSGKTCVNAWQAGRHSCPGKSAHKRLKYNSRMPLSGYTIQPVLRSPFDRLQPSYSRLLYCNTCLAGVKKTHAKLLILP